MRLEKENAARDGAAFFDVERLSRKSVRRHSSDRLKDPAGDLVRVSRRIRTTILEVSPVSVVNEAMREYGLTLHDCRRRS